MFLVRPRIFLGALLFLAYPLCAHAAPHPASAEECAKLTTLGIACTIGKTLYDPAARVVGDEVAEATKFLLERNGSGTRDTFCYKSQTDRITKLNPQFRVSLYKALSEIEKQYGGKNIIQSGFRCAGGAHNKGCAADIIWTSCKNNPKPSLWPPRLGKIGPWECSSDRWDAPEQQWIDANGKNAPYNIHFPYRYYPEGHHVEPVNTKDCVNTPVTGSGNPSGTSPTSGLSNAIRQALGVQPQLPPQPPLPMQPIAPQQSPLGAFMQPVPTVTPTSGTDVVIGGVSDQLGGGDESTGTSSADVLEKLAFGDKATSTVNATSVPLIINGKDVGGLRATQNNGASSTTSSGGGSIVQNTFITDDLSWQGANTNLSGYRKILANIKSALLAILQKLQPFRGNTTSEEYEYEH